MEAEQWSNAMRHIPFSLIATSIFSLWATGGCGPTDSVNEPSDQAMPDFTIRDVNPASARYNSDVSPSDYLEKISAWYFGHAT